jgi:hypothetical protein
MKKPSDQRAFAILTVVLILFGLFIIGVPFLVTMRLHRQASETQLWQAKAKFAAIGAANHAMASLVRTLESVEAAGGNNTFCTPSIDVSSELDVDMGLLEQGVKVASAPGSGDTEIALESVSSFSVGQRVRIVHPAETNSHESANVQRIDTQNKRIKLDRALTYGYTGDTLVYPSVISPKGLMVSVSVQDEQGKVNINSATRLLLENIFRQAKISDPAKLADAAINFRQQRHPFRTLGELQLCGDADLPSDKRQALTMDELERLREVCTVSSSRYSDETLARHPVNINTAPRDVLIAVLTGLTSRNLTNPETIAATNDSRRDDEGNVIVQPNTGDGVLSELCFPAGFDGKTWTIRCTEVDSEDNKFTYSVSDGSKEFTPYTISSSNSETYVSDDGEISFRITNGGTDFAVDDRFIIKVNEANNPVAQDVAEGLADRIRVATTLATDIGKDATEIHLASTEKFPDNGWIQIDGDLVQYSDNDQNNNILTVATNPNYEDAGVSASHKAGPTTKVELIFTDWADFNAILDLAQKDGELTAEAREAIYRNGVNPNGRYVARSTTGIVFRSGDAYSVEATGIVNSERGQECAKFVTRRLLQPSQTADSTWVIDSQVDFLELLQQTPQPALTSHSNLSSIRDLNNVNCNVKGIQVTEAPNSGTDEISVANVSSFRVGQRIEVISADKKQRESANVTRIITGDTPKIVIDRKLKDSYDGEAKVYPAGAVALSPSRLVIDANRDNAAQRFDEGSLANFLVLEDEITQVTEEKRTPSGGNIQPIDPASPRNVDIEGLYIGEESVANDTGALAYRAYDYDGETETHTGQNLKISTGAINSGQIEFWFKPIWPNGLSRDFQLFDMVSGGEEYQNRLSLKVNKTGVQTLASYLVMRITDSVLRDADISTVAEANVSEVRVPVSTSRSISDRLLLESGAWHHFKMYWKGSNYGEMALFVDGRLVGSYWPAARLLEDNTSLVTDANQTYKMDSLTSRTGEYSPEFNDGSDFSAKIIGDEVVEHLKVVYTNPQNLHVPGTADEKHRARRRTVARPHFEGEPVMLFGYTYYVNQEWYHWYRARYPDKVRLYNNQFVYDMPHLLKGEGKTTGGVSYVEFSALAHNLSHVDKVPKAVLSLKPAGTPAAHKVIGERVDANPGNPEQTNFKDGSITVGSAYVPYLLEEGKDAFPSTGFVFVMSEDGSKRERLFYDRAETKSFDVWVDEAQVPPVPPAARTHSLTVLHVSAGTPPGRGNLGTDPQEFVEGASVRLASVELRYSIVGEYAFAGNSNYARGVFRPFVSWAELTADQQTYWSGQGWTQLTWDDPTKGSPGAEASWNAFVALDGTKLTSKSSGHYEWIGYTWPNVEAEVFYGGDPTSKTRQNGEDCAQRQVDGVWRHYLVGPGLGMARNQQGSQYGLPTGISHAGSPAGLATVVYPVFFSNYSRIGVNDRVTFRDDDGNQEEKVILHASYGGELFTISDKESPNDPAFLSQQYEYARHPLVLKFPTGQLPGLVKANTDIWLGSSSRVDSPLEMKSSPKDAANGVFDEVKVSHNSLGIQHLHSVLLYGDSGIPGKNKRSSTSDPLVRMQTHITNTQSPPFSIRVGALARFLDWGWNNDQPPPYPSDTNDYLGRWYFQTLGIPKDTPLAPWMWLNNSYAQGWPRFGYLKIDDEVLFYQMLYSHPTSNAVAYVARDVAQIPEATLNDPGIAVEVNTTEGFANQGYAIIEFVIRNPGYGNGELDHWMRNPDGSVKQENGQAVENPNYAYKNFLYYYGDVHPYISYGDYYHPHDTHHFEVIYYHSKDETHLIDIQRGLMDTVPYPVPGPGSADFDFSATNPPRTFADGIINAPGPTGQERASGLAGNSYLRIRALNGVEFQVLQRGCLGTAWQRHAIGTPLMPLEDFKGVILTGPLQPNGTLPVYRNSLADPNNVTKETTFPERGLLELSTGEVVGYSSRGPSAFGGVNVLRERFGTKALESGNKDYLRTIPAVTDIDTNPTPDFFPDNMPGDLKASPYVARLLPFRYFDGYPRRLDDSGESVARVSDYDAPGAVFLKAGKAAKGATWKSVQWAQQLPEPASSEKPFEIHVVVRLGDDAPGWDANPDESQEDGLFRFSSLKDPSSADAVVGPFYFTANGEAPSQDYPAYKADRIEVRVFFKYPDEAYNTHDGKKNDWKKTPYFDRLEVTYETEPKVLHSEDISF